MLTSHFSIVQKSIEKKIEKGQIVGNKKKDRIPKQVLKENKARQILRKTKIFYPLIRTRT